MVREQGTWSGDRDIGRWQKRSQTRCQNSNSDNGQSMETEAFEECWANPWAWTVYGYKARSRPCSTPLGSSGNDKIIVKINETKNGIEPKEKIGSGSDHGQSSNSK